MDLPSVVTRDALPQRRLARAIREGDVIPVLPGVWLRSDVSGDPAWRATALMRWNPNAIVVGAMAARLTFWPELGIDAIDVAAPTNLRRAGYRFTRRTVPNDLTCFVGDLRVTVPALTAIDLAGATDGESIDRVLRVRRARIGDLVDALTATGHRRGNADTARLLLESRSEPWSIAERRAHALLRAAGITGWVANALIIARRTPYAADIAFLRERLIIEIDGRQFHSDRRSFEHDRIRQNDFVLDDWTVLRFTATRLDDAPEVFIADVRAGLALAARRR